MVDCHEKYDCFADLITAKDDELLRFLTDVRLSYLDVPGFRIEFEFAENEFFTNKVLTKSYFYQQQAGYGGDFIYDHAEGMDIQWKEGKDLTVKIETKRQRNKSNFLCYVLIQIQIKLASSNDRYRSTAFSTFSSLQSHAKTKVRRKMRKTTILMKG